MRFGIKKGWLPAVLTAWVGILLFMPGDAVTEGLALFQVFIVTVLLLLALSRFTAMTDWPVSRQRLTSWCVAVAATAIVCL